MTIVTRILIGFIALVTILPLFSVGAWWVRLCDAPRLHTAVALLLPITLLAIWIWQKGWSLEPCLLMAISFGLAAWQLSHVLPYLPIASKELSDARMEDEVHTLTVVNLKFENDDKAQVLQQLQELDSDLLLLIEYDQAWADGLARLQERYAFSQGVIREKGLGLMLWSKLPLVNAEVRYLVSEKRPSVFAQLQMRDNRLIHFVGVHPTPPGLWDESQGKRHDSRIRDAELLIIAKLVAESPQRDWLISGDFNDVAWSHTTRLFQRMSGLKDPRVGRGLFNTYHAEYPLFRFPIDQVFLSPTARIHRLDRLKPAGSDHFAITTAFCLEGQQPNAPAPEGNDVEQAEEMIQEGLDDADDEGKS